MRPPSFPPQPLSVPSSRAAALAADVADLFYATASGPHNEEKPGPVLSSCCRSPFFTPPLRPLCVFWERSSGFCEDCAHPPPSLSPESVFSWPSQLTLTRKSITCFPEITSRFHAVDGRLNQSIRVCLSPFPRAISDLLTLTNAQH